MLFQELLDKGEGVATVTDRVFDFKRHLCEGLIEAIGLEDRVPAKRVVASGLNNAAIASAIEHNWFCVRTLTEGKDALCICCLILKVLNHFPQTFTADAIQKILDVRARKAIKSIEAEADVFNKHGRVAFGSS